MDERDILYALLHEATKGNSLMAQWLRYGTLYMTSEQIVDIKNKAEELRKRGAAINHQIDVGSIVCSSDDGVYYASRRVYPYFDKDSANPTDINPINYEKYTNLTQYLSGVDKILSLYGENIKDKTDDIVSRMMIIVPPSNILCSIIK